MTAGFRLEVVDAAMAAPTRPLLTVEGVSGALAALGTTPNEVAETLLRAGAAGRRGSKCGCVMARWAAQVWPEALNVAVTKDEAAGRAWLILYRPAGVELKVEAPQPVAGLICRFDAGLYPELDVDAEAVAS